jgi:hypothetical protein
MCRNSEGQTDSGLLPPVPPLPRSIRVCVRVPGSATPYSPRMGITRYETKVDAFARALHRMPQLRVTNETHVDFPFVRASRRARNRAACTRRAAGVPVACALVY